MTNIEKELKNHVVNKEEENKQQNNIPKCQKDKLTKQNCN